MPSGSPKQLVPPEVKSTTARRSPTVGHARAFSPDRHFPLGCEGTSRKRLLDGEHACIVPFASTGPGVAAQTTDPATALPIAKPTIKRTIGRRTHAPPPQARGEACHLCHVLVH